MHICIFIFLRLCFFIFFFSLFHCPAAPPSIELNLVAADKKGLAYPHRAQGEMVPVAFMFTGKLMRSVDVCHEEKILLTRVGTLTRSSIWLILI